MQTAFHDFERLRVLCGKLETTETPKPFAPFSQHICEYLCALSKIIMRHPETVLYPDVMTFGFYLKKSHIEQMRLPYEEELNSRLGRGLSFHICASNIPTIFAYSMSAALLAGNACIAKIPSKSFRQTEIICDCINQALSTSEYRDLANYVCGVQYPSDSNLTGVFSSRADIRLIWGGDQTVQNVRQYLLPPRAVELTFADRYSLAVIDAATYLAAKNKETVARYFYHDTYTLDQNGCSSPVLIYWLGNRETVYDAQRFFWDTLHKQVSEQYQLSPIIAMEKFVQICRMGIEYGAYQKPTSDNLISRAQVFELRKGITKYRSPGGYFVEYADTDLRALSEIIDEKFQTISYFGALEEELRHFVLENRLPGVDRIVPMGKTADFSLTWDGYDLIRHMSRRVM